MASTLGDLTGNGKVEAGILLTDGHLLVFQAGADPTAAWTKAIDRKLALGKSRPLAACFGNFLGEKEQAVVVLLKDEVLAFPVKNGKHHLAGFVRLTGQRWAEPKCI